MKSFKGFIKEAKQPAVVNVSKTLTDHINNVDQPVRNAVNKTIDNAVETGNLGTAKNPPSVTNMRSVLRNDPELQKQFPGVGHDEYDHFNELPQQQKIAKVIDNNMDSIINGGYRGFNHKNGPSDLDNATLAVTHMDHPSLLPFQQKFHSALANHPNPAISNHPATQNLGNRTAVNASGYWLDPNAGANPSTVPKGIDPATGKLSTTVGSQGHRYFGSYGNHRPPADN